MPPGPRGREMTGAPRAGTAGVVAWRQYTDSRSELSGRANRMAIGPFRVWRRRMYCYSYASPSGRRDGTGGETDVESEGRTRMGMSKSGRKKTARAPHRAVVKV